VPSAIIARRRLWYSGSVSLAVLPWSFMVQSCGWYLLLFLSVAATD
jgi:hypothetical protein